MPTSVPDSTCKEKRGEASNWDPFPPTGYLLLNSANLGRGTEGTCTFRFSPSNFASNFFGTSLFCQELSANKPIQVKIRPPLPGCIRLDSVEVSATWVHFL
jgi:hypothetical protein